MVPALKEKHVRVATRSGVPRGTPLPLGAGRGSVHLLVNAQL